MFGRQRTLASNDRTEDVRRSTLAQVATRVAYLRRFGSGQQVDH